MFKKVLFALFIATSGLAVASIATVATAAETSAGVKKALAETARLTPDNYNQKSCYHAFFPYFNPLKLISFYKHPLDVSRIFCRKALLYRRSALL